MMQQFALKYTLLQLLFAIVCDGYSELSLISLKNLTGGLNLLCMALFMINREYLDRKL